MLECLAAEAEEEDGCPLAEMQEEVEVKGVGAGKEGSEVDWLVYL